MLAYSSGGLAGGGCVAFSRKHNRMAEWPSNVLDFLEDFKRKYPASLCIDNGGTYSGDIYLSLYKDNSENHLHIFRKSCNNTSIVFRNKIEKKVYSLPLIPSLPSQEKIYSLLSAGSLQKPQTQHRSFKGRKSRSKSHSRTRSKSRSKSKNSWSRGKSVLPTPLRRSRWG